MLKSPSQSRMLASQQHNSHNDDKSHVSPSQSRDVIQLCDVTEDQICILLRHLKITGFDQQVHEHKINGEKLLSVEAFDRFSDIHLKLSKLLARRLFDQVQVYKTKGVPLLIFAPVTYSLSIGMVPETAGPQSPAAPPTTSSNRPFLNRNRAVSESNFDSLSQRGRSQTRDSDPSPEERERSTSRSSSKHGQEIKRMVSDGHSPRDIPTITASGNASPREKDSHTSNKQQQQQHQPKHVRRMKSASLSPRERRQITGSLSPREQQQHQQHNLKSPKAGQQDLELAKLLNSDTQTPKASRPTTSNSKGFKGGGPTRLSLVERQSLEAQQRALLQHQQQQQAAVEKKMDNPPSPRLALGSRQGGRSPKATTTTAIRPKMKSSLDFLSSSTTKSPQKGRSDHPENSPPSPRLDGDFLMTIQDQMDQLQAQVDGITAKTKRHHQHQGQLGSHSNDDDEDDVAGQEMMKAQLLAAMGTLQAVVGQLQDASANGRKVGEQSSSSHNTPVEDSHSSTPRGAIGSGNSGPSSQSGAGAAAVTTSPATTRPISHKYQLSGKATVAAGTSVTSGSSHGGASNGKEPADQTSTLNTTPAATSKRFFNDKSVSSNDFRNVDFLSKLGEKMEALTHDVEHMKKVSPLRARNPVAVDVESKSKLTLALLPKQQSPLVEDVSSATSTHVSHIPVPSSVNQSTPSNAASISNSSNYSTLSTSRNPGEVPEKRKSEAATVLSTLKGRIARGTSNVGQILEGQGLLSSRSISRRNSFNFAAAAVDNSPSPNPTAINTFSHPHTLHSGSSFRGPISSRLDSPSTPGSSIPGPPKDPTPSRTFSFTQLALLKNTSRQSSSRTLLVDNSEGSNGKDSDAEAHTPPAYFLKARSSMQKSPSNLSLNSPNNAEFLAGLEGKMQALHSTIEQLRSSSPRSRHL